MSSPSGVWVPAPIVRGQRHPQERGGFTPVKNLQLADLPQEWQCEKSLDVIRHLSQRVVMVYIPRMSSERPTSIFSNRPHYGGTGFAYYVDRDVVKVRTNLHVIFNAEEAGTAMVQFSLEVPGKRNTRVIRLHATARDFHTNALEDYASITCCTSRRFRKYLHVFRDVPVLSRDASFFADSAETTRPLAEKRGCQAAGEFQLVAEENGRSGVRKTLPAAGEHGRLEARQIRPIAAEHDRLEVRNVQTVAEEHDRMEVRETRSFAEEQGGSEIRSIVLSAKEHGSQEATESSMVPRERGNEMFEEDNHRVNSCLGKKHHHNADEDDKYNDVDKRRPDYAAHLPCWIRNGMEVDGLENTVHEERIHRADRGSFFGSDEMKHLTCRAEADESVSRMDEPQDGSEQDYIQTVNGFNNSIQVTQSGSGGGCGVGLKQEDFNASQKIAEAIREYDPQHVHSGTAGISGRCRRPTLENGDYVAILSHPGGSEKCFSVGPAALHDPMVIGSQRKPNDYVNRKDRECDVNGDEIPTSGRGVDSVNAYDNKQVQGDPVDGDKIPASLDLVNDRFRTCKNRVYHTHTTFGCSGAPVLLFKRSLWHLQIPVVDYSQHSGTCVFRDGASLGFATCFTPPVSKRPDGEPEDLQQCYTVARSEGRVFRNAENLLETRHLVTAESTHIVGTDAGYCYSVDRGTVVRRRILSRRESGSTEQRPPPPVSSVSQNGVSTLGASQPTMSAGNGRNDVAREVFDSTEENFSRSEENGVHPSKSTFDEELVQQRSAHEKSSNPQTAFVTAGTISTENDAGNNASDLRSSFAAEINPAGHGEGVSQSQLSDRIISPKWAGQNKHDIADNSNRADVCRLEGVLAARKVFHASLRQRINSPTLNKRYREAEVRFLSALQAKTCCKRRKSPEKTRLAQARPKYIQIPDEAACNFDRTLTSQGSSEKASTSPEIAKKKLCPEDETSGLGGRAPFGAKTTPHETSEISVDSQLEKSGFSCVGSCDVTAKPEASLAQRSEPSPRESEHSANSSLEHGPHDSEPSKNSSSEPRSCYSEHSVKVSLEPVSRDTERFRNSSSDPRSHDFEHFTNASSEPGSFDSEHSKKSSSEPNSSDSEYPVDSSSEPTSPDSEHSGSCSSELRTCDSQHSRSSLSQLKFSNAELHSQPHTPGDHNSDYFQALDKEPVQDRFPPGAAKQPEAHRTDEKELIVENVAAVSDNTCVPIFDSGLKPKAAVLSGYDLAVQKGAVETSIETPATVKGSKRHVLRPSTESRASVDISTAFVPHWKIRQDQLTAPTRCLPADRGSAGRERQRAVSSVNESDWPVLSTDPRKKNLIGGLTGAAGKRSTSERRAASSVLRVPREARKEGLHRWKVRKSKPLPLSSLKKHLSSDSSEENIPSCAVEEKEEDRLAACEQVCRDLIKTVARAEKEEVDEQFKLLPSEPVDALDAGVQNLPSENAAPAVDVAHDFSHSFPPDTILQPKPSSEVSQVLNLADDFAQLSVNAFAPDSGLQPKPPSREVSPAVDVVNDFAQLSVDSDPSAIVLQPDERSLEGDSPHRSPLTVPLDNYLVVRLRAASNSLPPSQLERSPDSCSKQQSAPEHNNSMHVRLPELVHIPNKEQKSEHPEYSESNSSGGTGHSTSDWSANSDRTEEDYMKSSEALAVQVAEAVVGGDSSEMTSDQGGLKERLYETSANLRYNPQLQVDDVWLPFQPPHLLPAPRSAYSLHQLKVLANQQKRGCGGHGVLVSAGVGFSDPGSGVSTECGSKDAGSALGLRELAEHFAREDTPEVVAAQGETRGETDFRRVAKYCSEIERQLLGDWNGEVEQQGLDKHPAWRNLPQYLPSQFYRSSAIHGRIPEGFRQGNSSAASGSSEGSGRIDTGFLRTDSNCTQAASRHGTPPRLCQRGARQDIEHTGVRHSRVPEGQGRFYNSEPDELTKFSVRCRCHTQWSFFSQQDTDTRLTEAVHPVLFNPHVSTGGGVFTRNSVRVQAADGISTDRISEQRDGEMSAAHSTRQCLLATSFCGDRPNRPPNCHLPSSTEESEAGRLFARRIAAQQTKGDSKIPQQTGSTSVWERDGKHEQVPQNSLSITKGKWTPREVTEKSWPTDSGIHKTLDSHRDLSQQRNLRISVDNPPASKLISMHTRVSAAGPTADGNGSTFWSTGAKLPTDLDQNPRRGPAIRWTCSSDSMNSALRYIHGSSSRPTRSVETVTGDAPGLFRDSGPVYAEIRRPVHRQRLPCQRWCHDAGSFRPDGIKRAQRQGLAPQTQHVIAGALESEGCSFAPALNPVHHDWPSNAKTSRFGAFESSSGREDAVMCHQDQSFAEKTREADDRNPASQRTNLKPRQHQWRATETCVDPRVAGPAVRETALPPAELRHRAPTHAISHTPQRDWSTQLGGADISRTFGPAAVRADAAGPHQNRPPRLAAAAAAETTKMPGSTPRLCSTEIPNHHWPPGTVDHETRKLLDDGFSVQGPLTGFVHFHRVQTKLGRPVLGCGPSNCAVSHPAPHQFLAVANKAGGNHTLCNFHPAKLTSPACESSSFMMCCQRESACLGSSLGASPVAHSSTDDSSSHSSPECRGRSLHEADAVQTSSLRLQSSIISESDSPNVPRASRSNLYDSGKPVRTPVRALNGLPSRRLQRYPTDTGVEKADRYSWNNPADGWCAAESVRDATCVSTELGKSVEITGAGVTMQPLSSAFQRFLGPDPADEADISPAEARNSWMGVDDGTSSAGIDGRWSQSNADRMGRNHRTTKAEAALTVSVDRKVPEQQGMNMDQAEATRRSISGVTDRTANAGGRRLFASDIEKPHCTPKRSTEAVGTGISRSTLSSAFERFFGLTADDNADASATRVSQDARSEAQHRPPDVVTDTDAGLPGESEPRLYDLTSVVRVVLETGMVNPPDFHGSALLVRRDSSQHPGAEPLATGAHLPRRQLDGDQCPEPDYIDMNGPPHGEIHGLGCGNALYSGTEVMQTYCGGNRVMSGQVTNPGSARGFFDPGRGLHYDGRNFARVSTPRLRPVQGPWGSCGADPTHQFSYRHRISTEVFAYNPRWVSSGNSSAVLRYDRPPQVMSRDHQAAGGRGRTRLGNHLSCLCTCTPSPTPSPSTPLSPHNEITDAFRFPHQDFFNQSLQNNSSDYSHYPGAHAAYIDSFWTRFRPSSSFHNPLYQSHIRQHVSRTSFQEPVSHTRCRQSAPRTNATREAGRGFSPMQWAPVAPETLPRPAHTLSRTVSDLRLGGIEAAQEATSQRSSYTSSQIPQGVRSEQINSEYSASVNSVWRQKACRATVDVLDTSVRATLWDLGIVQVLQSDDCDPPRNGAKAVEGPPKASVGVPEMLPENPSSARRPGVLPENPSSVIVPRVLPENPSSVIVPRVLPENPSSVIVPRVLPENPSSMIVPRVLPENPSSVMVPRVLPENPSSVMVPRVLPENPSSVVVPRVLPENPSSVIVPRVLPENPSSVVVPRVLPENPSSVVVPRVLPENPNSEETSKRELFIKNEKKRRWQSMRYSPGGKRRRPRDLLSGSGDQPEDIPSERSEQPKEARANSESDETAVTGASATPEGKADGHPRWRQSEQIGRNPGSEMSGRDVCYVTVPVDIRTRLEKVARWITTQIFGCPQVHLLTPRDADTFGIQQNFHLTMQIMALNG